MVDQISQSSRLKGYVRLGKISFQTSNRVDTDFKRIKLRETTAGVHTYRAIRTATQITSCGRAFIDTSSHIYATLGRSADFAFAPVVSR